MNKKNIFLIIFVLLFLVAFVYSAWFLFGNYYYSWKIGQNWKKFEAEFTNYLKNDKYGGKTPEETYKMFINELKQGNIENASKYFYWEDQIDEQKRLQKMKDEGKLEEYVNGLPEWEKMKEEEYWDEDGRLYTWIETLEEPVKVQLPLGNGEYQEEIFEPGEYKQEIIFQLNKKANIWKIYSL